MDRTRYQDLLLPELEAEIENTRKILDRLPDGRNEFKPHEKSFNLSQLAGHLAEMPMFVQLALTNPDIDLGSNGYVPLLMESKEQVLAAFSARADQLLALSGPHRMTSSRKVANSSGKAI